MGRCARFSRMDWVQNPGEFVLLFRVRLAAHHLCSGLIDVAPYEMDFRNGTLVRDTLEVIRRRIDHEIKLRISMINRRLNSLSPIATLPAEILDDIFLATFPNGRLATTGRLKKLATVCYHWWIHVRGSGVLWSCIDLGAGMDSVNRHLSRAGGARLDVQIPLASALRDNWKFKHGIPKPYTTPFVMAPFLLPIIQRKAQWRTLTIIGPYLSDMDPELGACLSMELEELRGLRIRSSEHDYSPVPVVLAGGPKVQMLDLERVPPMKCIVAGFSRLRSLSVQTSYIVDATATLYSILELSAKSLEFLRWLDVRDGGDSPKRDVQAYIDAPLVLPHLTTLIVIANQAAVVIALCALRTPGLERMTCVLYQSGATHATDSLRLLQTIVQPPVDSPCHVALNRPNTVPSLDADMSTSAPFRLVVAYNSGSIATQASITLNGHIWPSLFPSLPPDPHAGQEERQIKWRLVVQDGPENFYPILEAFPRMISITARGDHARRVALLALCLPNPRTQQFVGQHLERIEHTHGHSLEGNFLEKMLEFLSGVCSARRAAYVAGRIQREAEIWVGSRIFDPIKMELCTPSAE